MKQNIVQIHALSLTGVERVAICRLAGAWSVQGSNKASFQCFRTHGNGSRSENFINSIFSHHFFFVMFPFLLTFPFNFQQEFENNSGWSQIFWLLNESELTPSNANILDGRYAVFRYVTENQDFLADVKVGDVIESIKLVSGLDNLVNPSYKIAG